MALRNQVILQAATAVLFASVCSQSNAQRLQMPVPVSPEAQAARRELARLAAGGTRYYREPLRPAAHRPAYVPNEYAVRFRAKAWQTGRVAMVQDPRVRVISQIPQLHIQRLRIEEPAAVEALRLSPDVLYMEPLATRYPLVVDPNDPAYNDYDHNITTDPEVFTWYKWDSHMTENVAGWSIWPNKYYSSSVAKGTNAVLLAVVDSGIDYDHPDFINAGGTGSSVSTGGQLLRPLDRSIIGGVVDTDAWDEYGHGTHVTGIAAAATNNAVGTVGVGYNANVLSIKVVTADGMGYETDIAAGIVYAADAGAQVCNLSLGGYMYSQAEQDAINYAWYRGMMCVAAIGNDGTFSTPNYPACLSRVFAVSACSRTSLASYSNYGEQVAITAPGGDFDYDIMWLLGVYSTMPTYHCTLNDDAEAAMNYEYLMGTSMASPQVAGLASLYIGQKGLPRTPATIVQTWQALQRASDFSGGWNQFYGYGLMHVYNTLNLTANPNPRYDTVGGIVGMVQYKGSPAANATVKAIPAVGAIQTVSTRPDGGYRFTNIAPGTYTVRATFQGDSHQLTGLVVPVGCDIPGIDFNIMGVATTLTVPDVTAGAGTNARLTATLRRADTNAIVDYEPIHFLVDGTAIGTAYTNATGVATVIYAMPAGPASHAVKADFLGEAIFLASSGTGTVSLPVIATQLAVPNRTANAGSAVTLNATLTRTSNGAAVAGQTVGFKVAGTGVGSGVTDAAGVAAYGYTVAVATGANTLEGSFAGGGGYSAASASATLTVVGAPTSMYVPDRTGIYTTTIALKGYLKRTSDNAWLSGRTVSFAVAGTTVGSATTSAAGEAALNWGITDGAASRTITARFGGDTTYDPCEGSATLTSTSVATKTYVVDRLNVKIKAYTVLKAYLYTLANAIIPGKTMSMTVDGTSVGSQATNSSGYISFGYTVPEGAGAGDRVIGASWAGNAGYPASSNTGKLGVLQGNLYLWTYVRSGKVGTTHPLKSYVRSLPDYVIQPGKSITFKVNGSVIGSANVAADGWATVNWAIPAGEPTGSHTATAEFAGDSWYLAASGGTAFNVVP